MPIVAATNQNNAVYLFIWLCHQGNQMQLVTEWITSTILLLVLCCPQALFLVFFAFRCLYYV